MNLLLYSWNANNEQLLADNLIKLGFEVIWFRKECRHYTRDMELAMEMIPFVHAKGVEAVISFNYFPILSMICNTCQIPYYSWVYDCPHFTLYARQVTLPCNHIGIFDQEMVRQLEAYGVKTVSYVPLAVDSAYFAGMIGAASAKEREKYQCDISFVGSLYTGEHDYYEKVIHGVSIPTMEDAGELSDTGCGKGSEEGTAGAAGRRSEVPELAKAIARQCFSYRADYLREGIIEGEIDLNGIHRQMEAQGLMLGEDYFARPEDILLSAVLEKRVTVEERRILLTEAARRFVGSGDGSGSHDTARSGQKKVDTGEARQKIERAAEDYLQERYTLRLYTGSYTKGIPELDAVNRGTVDYHTQMPLVFAGSRINLNISLRSIHSGIPLRVLDIMACGGFVLSNWQPEIAEYFEEGVEIVTFNSLEECMDKIAYYLAQEEERVKIAANGQKKVRELFSYQTGLERLFTS